MTWLELYDKILKMVSSDKYADNIIGSLMDLYESWDWQSTIPDGADKILSSF